MDDRHNEISDEMLAAFLDGNASESEVLQIIGAAGRDRELQELLALADEIDTPASVRRFDATPFANAAVSSVGDSFRNLPVLELAAADNSNMCSFECEIHILRQLHYDVRNWSLLETAKANNWLRDGGTPLHHVGRLLELKGMHVERRYDATLEDIAAGLADKRFVIAVVDKNILNPAECEAECGGEPALHAVCVNAVPGRGEIEILDLDKEKPEVIAESEFLAAWRASDFYMITATNEDGKYSPKPISVEGVELSGDLIELTEAIAENVHDIWARARMDEGWRYGTERNDARKLHPDLVPYSKLTEREKEYDRIMAMQTLRLVKRLGFDIVKR